MSPARKPTADELAEGGPPPPPAAANAPKPIGVPEGYTVPRRGLVVDTYNALSPSATTISPRYFVGDEWAPASLSAEDRARLQRAMVDAGVIPKGAKFRLGMWDETTRGAYVDLLSFANGAGLDVKAALGEYARMRDVYGDPDEMAERQPLVTRLTNPDDLRSTFEVVARRKIGRKLRPEEAERFVKAYQTEEAGVQQQDYDLDETGGTVTEAPDPQAFLAERLAKEYGVEVGATAIAEQGADFLDLLDEVGG